MNGLTKVALAHSNTEFQLLALWANRSNARFFVSLYQAQLERLSRVGHSYDVPSSYPLSMSL